MNLTYEPIPTAMGLTGVSLKLQGVSIPNNSLVNLDDLLYRSDNMQRPTNTNGFHDKTLVCVTDLVDCCESQELGDWYYPDGNPIELDDNLDAKFQSNRGQNNGQQIYGSVRLWRRYTPPERGLFSCELPDANNDTQILYVNICEFLSAYMQ